MRKQLTRAILVTGTIAAALSLGVGPAFAVTLWTVNGGPNWTSVQSGSTTTFKLTDTTQSDSFTCKTATGAGTVTDEMQGTNTAIGSVTSGTFGDSNNLCTSSGIFGNPTGTAKLTATSTLNVSSYNSTTGVTTGTITNVASSLTASAFFASCTIVVKGTAGVTYTNSTHVLAFITTGDSLKVTSVSGTCPGVAVNDVVTFASSNGGETVTGTNSMGGSSPITITSP